MKRYLLLAPGLAAVLVAGVSAQQPNNVPTNNVSVPFITVAVQTNVVTQVQPLALTADQMNQVISNLEAIGIGGSVPITAASLQRVMVVQRGGTFTVTMAVGGSQAPPPPVASPTNGVPFIRATTQTNVVVHVQPLVLTAAQMNLVIGSLQAVGTEPRSGIGGNVPITAAILQRVVVLQRGDGSFLVTMQLLGQ